MIQTYINELIKYGLRAGLFEPADRTYVVNRLLELLQLREYEAEEIETERPLFEILGDITEYALGRGLLEDDSVTMRDLFDTQVMGCLTPAPSAVIREFRSRYEKSPEAATSWYYDFSRATNYIRTDRIARDEKWTCDSEYGMIDITINLSKPEKDPRDIARAAAAGSSSYPACLLCRENEGYAGYAGHPARQNHRLIPVTLGGEPYYLQYSPYVYYNEHCIILNERHIPMKIDRAAFVKLLDFTDQFPHYTAGSNADLPIVGGSILSHDHFQGGHYEFPMARAEVEQNFVLRGFPEVSAGTLCWPMSVIRLRSENASQLADAADTVLAAWRSYSDPEAFIYSHTEDTPHNTITPIARRRGAGSELDLVLRNNITTEEHPLGVYHPHQQYHHIKKENIGLIEVMGLAVLPARLKKELAALGDAILAGSDLRDSELTNSHADWAEEWLKERTSRGETVTKENITEIIQEEVGRVFVKVLECASVYKRDPKGRAAFTRFLDKLK